MLSLLEDLLRTTGVFPLFPPAAVFRLPPRWWVLRTLIVAPCLHLQSSPRFLIFRAFSVFLGTGSFTQVSARRSSCSPLLPQI